MDEEDEGMTIHAVYENGVFRPLEKVDLPEKCEVEFEPRRVQGQPESPRPGLIEVMAQIRADQAARGYHGRSEEEMRADEAEKEAAEAAYEERWQRIHGQTENPLPRDESR
jgi:predicted DNA-binding antitoxin AbrB/MazE fold protein